MSVVVAIGIHKGGVGKTTTCVTTAVYLAKAGKRVLVVDFDCQGNATKTLGVGVGVDSNGFVREHDVDLSVYEAMLNPDRSGRFAIVPTQFGVDLLPATLDLAMAPLEFSKHPEPSRVLQPVIESVREDYDIILIDSPTTLVWFAWNILFASDYIVIPIQLHAYSLRAVPQYQEVVLDQAMQINRTLKIGGYVCTCADRRTNLSAVIEEGVREDYGDLVFKTVIPLNTKIAESPLGYQPVSHHSPRSAGAQAYRALAAEFQKRFLD